MELLLSPTHSGAWHYASAAHPDPDCSACDDSGCPECDPSRFCEHGVDIEKHACTCETMTSAELAEFA